jgi:hypothetical protein
MNVFSNNKKFMEHKYLSEDEFEQEVVQLHRLFFGKKTIYIDVKKKIASKSLGGTIPDGFFFDLSDPIDPQFYLVEVELSVHNFFNHIFPQITKFFAFYKNQKQQRALVENLFSIVDKDPALKREFKKYLGDQEIYKFLSDIVDSNQNILLIIDGEKDELPEIMETYSDTWGRMVKHLVVKKYISGDETIFTMYPEYETIGYIPGPPVIEGGVDYSEEFHLEGVSEAVKATYQAIKIGCTEIDPSLIFNPQRYYISIRGNKNLVFLLIRKKKVRMVPLLPENEIREKIAGYEVKSLSESVQGFYNGPCAAVDIDSEDHIDEVLEMLKVIVERQSSISPDSEQ